MVRLTVNTADILRMLSGYETRAEDLTDAMNEIGQYMISRTMKRFKEEGPGWPPLSPATIRNRKRNRRGIVKILQDTGVLRGSIGSPSRQGIYEVGGREVKVGTTVPYAAVHQFGTNRAGRHHNVRIPARPFLLADERDVETMEDIILQYVLRGRR